MTIIKENPSSAKWWLEMEKKYASEQYPRFDLRTNKTMKEIIELSEQPFRTVQDKHEISKKQTSLFDNIDMDIETDCFCKAS